MPNRPAFLWGAVAVGCVVVALGLVGRVLTLPASASVVPACGPSLREQFTAAAAAWVATAIAFGLTAISAHDATRHTSERRRG